MKINPNNPVIHALSVAFDVVLTIVLFVLFCLPVVTAPAAATALYATLMGLMGNRVGGVCKYFLQSFRGNFAVATKAGAVLLGVGLILAADVYVCWGSGQEASMMLAVLRGVTVFCACFYLSVSIYTYAGIGRFVVTWKQSLYNAVIWTMGKLLSTLQLLVFTIVGVGALMLAWIWGLPLYFLCLFLQGLLLEKTISPPEDEPMESECES